jgi:outer membrane protein
MIYLTRNTTELRFSSIWAPWRSRLFPPAAVSRAGAVAVLLLAGVPLLAQQANPPSPLTLQQAVAVALEKNPGRKADLAETRAATAGVREARASLLPHITFSETGTRGNDPVYVFGSKLRQQRFTVNDLALNILNTPTPIGNFATRFAGTWNLFDSFASWRGVHRAERAKEAAAHQLERTDQEIVFRTIESYYGVLLAMKQLEVAEQALKTAQSTLDITRNRVESGLAVQSDFLSAQVQFATRQQELIRARSNLALTRAQLSTAMGVSADTEFEPTEALAERNFPAPSLQDLEKEAVQKRPDLNRVRSEEAAQQQSVAMAKSSFGPRINGFAGWEADNPSLFGGGGGNNWLAGIEVQFDLFQGGAKRAQLAREQAVQDKVEALKQAATDAIQLEVRRAYYDLDTARQQVDVARAAIAQAQESLRINQDRYSAGLSTITDLFGAEEAARRSQADYWQAIYRYHTGYANMELATGTLSPQSPVVTP